VGELAHLVQADEAGATLEGMRLAEDAVDRRRVARLRLEGEEAARHPLQAIPRLLYEKGPELVF
jgi:hypothetical protein